VHTEFCVHKLQETKPLRKSRRSSS